MSDYLKSAIITTRVSLESGCTLLGDVLDLLYEKYQFGFRSYGGVMRLRYDGGQCRGEDEIEQTVERVEDLDRDLIEQLVAKYRCPSVTGSFGMEGLDRLLDINVSLYPTFDPDLPVCLVSHLDAFLYRGLWDDDLVIDPEAAERMRALAIALGAHDLVDGFYTMNMEGYDEFISMGVQQLQDSLVAPAPMDEIRERKAISHELVSGIKRTRLSVEQLREAWEHSEVFETTNGFSILSGLVTLDLGDLGDLDDLDDLDD